MSKPVCISNATLWCRLRKQADARRIICRQKLRDYVSSQLCEVLWKPEASFCGLKVCRARTGMWLPYRHGQRQTVDFSDAVGECSTGSVSIQDHMNWIQRHTYRTGHVRVIVVCSINCYQKALELKNSFPFPSNRSWCILRGTEHCPPLRYCPFLKITLPCHRVAMGPSMLED